MRESFSTRGHMSSRPKRKSAEEAISKIRDVLMWESCSESSDAFKAAAERMEIEFNNAKRRRAAKALATPTSTDDEESDSGDDDSGSDDEGSAPSSSDLYTDPGSSSEEDDEEELASDNDNAPDVVLDIVTSPPSPIQCVSP
jgi:hypothetical protein